MGNLPRVGIDARLRHSSGPFGMRTELSADVGNLFLNAPNGRPPGRIKILIDCYSIRVLRPSMLDRRGADRESRLRRIVFAKRSFGALIDGVGQETKMEC
jgi:hypothetical protein